MDKNTLKIQALLERISNITTTYENQVADLRVELTLVSQERDELRQQVDNMGDSADGSVQAQPDTAPAVELT